MMNVKSISLFLVCRAINVHLANTKNNNNFEKIKVICNLKTVYVCTLHYLNRTFIHSLKNDVGCSQWGPQIV